MMLTCAHHSVNETKHVIIFRYLAREVWLTLAALTTILLLIFMSNQFVRYLNRAVSGQIPLSIIMKLMMLELPNLMSLLLPLGFYIALLLAYGRLYAEHEMTVLKACGYGPNQLLKHSYIMALVVCLFVGMIVMWISPLIAIERARLIKTSGIQTLIQTIVPGQFNAVGKKGEMFYVEAMNRRHTQAQHLFFAEPVLKNTVLSWKIMWADHAFFVKDNHTKEDYIVLNQGQEYEGIPGSAAFRVTKFAQYKARLPHPTFSAKQDTRTLKTLDLLPFFNPDVRKAAELQWRLSIPLMVLILTLLAIPLSYINPRTGKFARILPAILLYIIYANLLFVARDWLLSGKVGLWLGMSWVHLIFLAMAIFMIWRNRMRLV